MIVWGVVLVLILDLGSGLQSYRLGSRVTWRSSLGAGRVDRARCVWNAGERVGADVANTATTIDLPQQHQSGSRASWRLSMSSDSDGAATSVQDIPSSKDVFNCGKEAQFVVSRVPVDRFSDSQDAQIIHQLELTNSDVSDRDKKLTSSVYHATNGPVPRGSLSSIILVDGNFDELVGEEDLRAAGELVEGSVRWYLDSGGRINRLSIAVPSSRSADVQKKLGEMGFSASPLFTDEFSALHGMIIPSSCSHEVFSCESDVLLAYLVNKAQVVSEDAAAQKNTKYGAHLSNLLGRLLHDVGRPQDSVEHFTTSLQQDPSSASTFRNLGSAYQSVGNSQMAFASFQQAVQLDPTDALVYLKLAFFYEDFAKMDWDDAANHAERCYRYYLENVDPDDTSVLTRLGNLLVREHQASSAIEVYEKVLGLDASLHNVWFNKAHAHIKKGENKEAIESLRRTLSLEPSIAAASHMLKALSEDEAQKVSTSEEQYIRDLFNDYGSEYDNHVKKLLYSAPRVVRQELAKIYRGRFNIPEDEVRGVPAGVDDDSGCTVVVPTIKINNTLDILDLGCGTGLAGAWLKDYANSLTGVDLSDGMVEVARKKMIYQNLHITSIDSYLQNDCNTDFDLVVAVDVLSYIGDLVGLFKKVSAVLRSDAHFAFTIEAISKAADDEDSPEGADPARRSVIDDAMEEEVAADKHRGFRLLKSGRFGYAKTYVDRVLANMGSDIEVVMSRQFSPRLDAGNPVPGYLYVVHKRK